MTVFTKNQDIKLNNIEYDLTYFHLLLLFENKKLNEIKAFLIKYLF